MDDKDREDLLKVVSGSINQWTGNIQLPNGTKLTGLNVNGREDAQALLETIRGLALPELSVVPTLQSRADAVALLPVPEGLPVYQPGEAAQSLRQAQLRAKRRAVNAAARERKAVALAKSAHSKTPASRVRKPSKASQRPVDRGDND
ncbi:hypothetical protein [Stenotrophomonas sp. PA-6-5C]|uniref:hypothetical protein n=1 Tax=Stenotrophomonas sp. PA-6-5C TaxID=2665487 RepID=UPI001F47AE08|nr:hypothetical protein [Stenotrophomonas sp. PA-6-5C]